MPCWNNGIMTETEKMEIFLAIQHYRATSSFGGIVMHVQRARSTAGRLVQAVELLANFHQGALFVLGKRFVYVTLWKLFVLILLLTLTLKRMVSILLK